MSPFDTATHAFHEGVGEDIRPGLAVSIATAGDLVQWHPHGHVALARETGRDSAKRAFLAAHPNAAYYAGYGDFPW